MNKIIIIAFLIFGFSLNSIGQNVKSLSRNIKSLRLSAAREFKAAQYESAIYLYQSYFDRINFIDTASLFNVAEAYRLSKKYDKGITLFEQLASLNSKYKTNLAEIYALKDDYTKAVEVYKSIQTDDAELFKRIQLRIEGFKYKEDFQLDSLDWKMVISQINTNANESSPQIYKDGILYLTSSVINSPYGENNGVSYISFVPDSIASAEKKPVYDTSKLKKRVRLFYRKIPIDITPRNSYDNNTLRKKIRLPQTIVKNLAGNVDPFLQGLIKFGPIHLNASGDTVYYSKPVSTGKKQSKLGIFYAVASNSKWSEGEEVTKGYAENAFHPAASQDGKKIYFVSEPNNSIGGADLYYVERLGDTAWSTPRNAGDKINSIGTEVYPTIIGDTLYFSSNGKRGLGGQDIFAVKLNSSDEPANVGYPINSSFDDYGIVFNKNRSGGYFSSNRNGSNDVFAFNFKKILYRINGTMNYRSDNSVASEEKIYLVDLKTSEDIDSTLTDENGNYSFYVRPNHIYTVEQRESGKIKATYVINTKEPLKSESFGQIDQSSYAMSSMTTADKMLDSLNKVIRHLENEEKILTSQTSVDQSNPGQSADKRKLQIQSQLKALKSDVARLEYKKLEIALTIDPPRNSMAINSTKNTNSVILNIQLPGQSQKQRNDSIAYARQQLMINKRQQEDLLLRGDQLTKFNVYFGFSKFNLSATEQKILDSSIKVLKANPALFAVMGSFTDCSGPIDFNMQLSAKRSAAVMRYLIKNGIPKSRIRENHYGKNYLVQNCNQKRYNSNQQLLNRRTEIYLTTDGNLAWTDIAADTTTKYSVYTALGKKLSDFVAMKSVVVTANKKPDKAKNIIKPVDNNFDLKTVALKQAQLKPQVKPKLKSDTFYIVKPIISDKTASVNKKSDISTMVMAQQPSANTFKKLDAELKTDTFYVLKPTALDKTASINKKIDSLTITKAQQPSANTVQKLDTISADNDQISRQELLAALDSLAKLRREQERIVDYLTKRINKKPIQVFTYADSVTVEIFDSGIHDKDSVSVIYNNRLVVDKHVLKVDKPIKFKVRVDKESKNNEMVIVAENLGTYPPNTAVMIITDKFGKHDEIMLNTDLKTNEVVIFIRLAKKNN